MAQFADRNGTVRTLWITLDVVEQVQSQLGISLYKFEEVQRLQDDTIGTVKLLWLAAGSPGSFEEFAKAQTLQTIIDGSDAFLAEWCEFLPSRLSDPLREHHQATRELSAQTYVTAGQILDTILTGAKS